jgi:solute carrier family 25 phosphate transporter 23/24/25/41
MRAGYTIHHGETSMLGCMRSMVKNAGVWSLWRGNGVNCIQVGPESALMFFCYEWLKSTFLTDPLCPTLVEKFVFGAISGIYSMTLVYPLYLVQNRMCLAEPGIYNGIIDCFRQTIQQEGAMSLFKGYVPSFLRIIPYKGFDLCIFNQLKEKFVPTNQSIAPWQSMLFGGLASGFSQSLTYPLVVARTKLMAQGKAQGRPLVYNNAFDAIRKTYYGDIKLNLKAEGIRGLYNGCSANLMKMIPAVALQFTVYESCVDFFYPYFPRSNKK